MSLRNRVFRNLTAGAFGRLVNALQPLVLLPTFLAVWGENLYGEWLLVSSVPSFFMLAPDFGIAAVVSNRMATLTGEGNAKAAQDLFRSAFWLLLGCSVTVAVCGSIACSFIHWDRIFHLDAIAPSTAATIITIMSLQVCTLQLGNCVTGLYRCALRNDRGTYIASIIGVMELMTLVVSIRLGAPPLLVAFIGLCSRTMALGFYLFDTSRLPNAPRIGFSRIRFDLLRPLWLPALGNGGMPLLQVIHNQGMLTVIGVTLGTSAVAVFQSLRTLTNGFKSLFTLLSGAVLAELPHALGQRQFAAVGRLLRFVLLIGIVTGITALVGTWFCGGWVYNRWTQGKAEYDSVLCLALTFATLPHMLGCPASVYLHAANRLLPTVPMSLTCVLISMALMVALIPTLGIASAGYMTVVWETCNAAILTWTFRQSAPEIWRFFTDASLLAVGRSAEARDECSAGPFQVPPNA